MVKKILLTVLLLITTNVYAESPTDKGVYSLGGSVSFEKYKRDLGSDTDSFNLSPSFLYFIYDNVAVGGSLGYGKTWADSSDGERYGIGPTLRYYLPNKTVNPFFEVGYLYSKFKLESSSYTVEGFSNDYSIGFGLDYFLSRNVSLEPIIKYSWFNYKDESTYQSNFSDIVSTPFGSDGDEESLYIGIGINWFIF